ncbi:MULTISPECIES: LysR family transcriptional regulator [Pigmentiphaga]|uniref:LysR family transcriptional regulator n=1 Tax=Pigmentiphaga daeguensis TaxID=414049 RepID=A0ABN1C5N2_9BURK|nr:MULTISPECIES: LysR family transcriptional regulator [unclassified Pigmentiphaga]OVZ66412.1 LysR family transcriptional regulator [Pigmentiphaga sp. NML030171]
MDMRLLCVFDEVYKTRSVSRAAENLEIPQTSVSLALARLRRQFNDSLFVRTSEGMMPTPHAMELRVPLQHALELLRSVTQQRVVFDPLTSKRHFRVSMTDISHLEFLPRLVRRVETIAPRIHVEVLRIGPDTASRLESGESDLAVGYMPALEAGFYQQKLFDEGFACVARKNHPRLQGKMTRQLFKRERHVSITAPGTGHELVERELKRIGVDHSVVLSLHTLPGLGNLLAHTDLIATVPARVAQTLAGIAAVKLIAPPFPLPVFAIKQHWHERFHHDPANRWLRSLIAELFLE